MLASEMIKQLKTILSDEDYEVFLLTAKSFTIRPKLMVDNKWDVSSNFTHFVLEVVYRGNGRFAIQDRMNYFYNKVTGEYDYSCGERNYAEWLSETRFSLEEAMELAEVEVEKIKLMGLTIQQFIEKFGIEED